MFSIEILTLLICLASLFSYINYRFIKWTPTIGIMALSLVASVLIIISSQILPNAFAPFIQTITSINFHGLMMNGMLSFLLFAGSIHIDAKSLRKERLPIAMLATIGILISTFVVGFLLHWIFSTFNLDVNYVNCFLFAALISPTDPIAVLAILKKSGIGKSLELKIAGESLFNDGVAVVVFVTILEVAQTGVEKLPIADVSTLFLKEAGGGTIFGILLGYLGFSLLKSIDRYDVEIMITLSIVMGGYLLANKLHVSGPLAMVIAGIVIGAKGRETGISEVTKDYLYKFWELIENILNALLFMLIGFEMLVIKANGTVMVLGLVAIAVVLFARWVSVAIPITLLRYKMHLEKNAIRMLTWGGLRGGLSVALALSLPNEMHRDLFLPITYTIVIFSIIVQGLTVDKLFKKTLA